MCIIRRVKRFGCMLLIAIAFSVTRTSLGQSVVPLRVALSLDSQEIPLHALLEAHLEISNEDAEHAYVVHLGLDNEGAFSLTVKKPDGTIAVFRKQSAEGFHTEGSYNIQPGKTYSQKLILNRWYEFPTPGTYNVTVTMDAKATEGHAVGTSSSAGPDLRATVSKNIVISSRDEAYLRQQCDQLLDTIRSAPSYEDVFKAADSLNAINDPIAASYLTQAAEARPPVAYRFILGLESLATKGAVEGLLELARNPNTETKVSALSSLGRLEIASQNGPLKAQIKSGLAAMSQH